MNAPIFAVSCARLSTGLSLSLSDGNKTKATTLAPTLHPQPTTGPTTRWDLLSIEESLSNLKCTTELPTIEDFFGIVGKCRKQRNLGHAHCVHAHIHDKGLDAHKFLGNHLVPLFVECGSVLQAHQVFLRLIHQNEYSWTSLIQGYVEHGDFQYAFDLFEMMQADCVQPSTCTFLALLKACAKMKWRERGREMNAQIDNLGYESDPYIGNSLVGMYAKCGSFIEARESFDKLLVRDIVSWNALMSGYVEHGMDKEALLCAKQLQSEGLSPDAITFVCILKACGNLGAFEMSCRVHTEILERGIDRNPIVGNALVDTYAGAGKFAEARSVLDGLPSRDMVSWCVLITGYIEHGFGDEALNCVDQMQQEGVHPDGLTYVCSLKACGIIGAIYFGEILHMELVVEGFEENLHVGNVLVDMYAKCGCLLEAQEVFDELRSMRDTVSWNTLLAAYVEHGRSEEALVYLEEMQSEGVLRDAATYVSSFKACSITGNLTKGQELLVEVSLDGFNEEPLVVNSLVDLFAKCGSFAEARDLFEELQPVKDVVTWNALVSGYAEHGDAIEVLNCLELMQQEGVSPDVITFVCGLKACGSMRAPDRFLQLHAEMVRYGFDKNTFIENTLVDGYAKCGFFTEARQVLEHISYQETLSWSALMAGLLEHGLAEEALICLEQMEGEGVPLNKVTYLCSLRACASLGAVNKGQEVHANIVKQGYSSDSYVGNSLVDMYSKCGLFQDAHMVLTECMDRDVVSWTTLISGFTEYGLGGRALEMLMDMQLEGVFPNAATYICCLRACSATRAMDRGLAFHMEAIKAGFDEDHLLTNSLIEMYSKCGTHEEACIMFKRLLKPDVISWTALFSGAVEHGLAQEVLMYFDQMQQDGVSPTSATFLYSIKGCADIRAIQKGHFLHMQTVQFGLEEDASVGIALVDMYSKCGCHDEAYALLNFLQLMDAVPRTALISGYAECGHTKEALECLKEMQEVGMISDVMPWNAAISAVSQQGDSREALVLFAQLLEQGILPDCATLLSILELYGDTASIEHGRRVHAQSLGNQPSDKVICTALIDMYSKCGSMKDAQHVFDEASRRDCFNWTAILSAYARQGNSDCVFTIFKRMREETIYPDDVTFLSILSACRYSGLVEKGHMFFEAMVNEYGILPTIKHHNCMVDLLCRAGQLSEAASLLKTMDEQPDSATWSAMLSACHGWGDMELSRQMFENRAGFGNENNASAFVLMSNIAAISADEMDVEDSG